MKGLVLAGGKSTRMGTPKADLNYHGEAEYLRCIKLLQSACDEVFLSTSSSWAPQGENGGAVVLSDQGPSRGPLSGITTAFEHRPNEAFIVLACDMPHFGPEALAGLLAERDESLQATCFALDGTTPEPLCAIYEASAASDLQEALRNDKRCARRVLESMKIKCVVPRFPQWVSNMNEKLNIQVHFVAQLRESAGKSGEVVITHKTTPRGLFEELSSRYHFALSPEYLRVAVNDSFTDWNVALNNNDRVMFVPPVAGG